MSETYETMFTTRADEIDLEFDKVIRFEYIDDEGVTYTETVQVGDIEFDEFHTHITGYSEVLNEIEDYKIRNHTFVEVLGG